MNKKTFLKYFGIFDAYFAAIVLAVIFALFCSGRVGWFILLVMIFAPGISVLWTLISIKGLRLSIECREKLLERGEKASFSFTVFSKFFLLPPCLYIKLGEEEHIKIDYEEDAGVFKIYPSLFGRTRQDVEFETVYAGRACINISEIEVYDIFGIFHFKVKIADENVINNGLSIGILPRNELIQTEEEWLLQAREAAFDGEEPESSIDDVNQIFGGFPGYEHREYRPGDPLKRINYKLSARMGKYQVRLDEKQAVAGISVCLANTVPRGVIYDASSVSATSACLEELLAVTRYLFMHDFSVSVYLPKGEEESESEYIITNEFDIEKIRQSLAYVSFFEESKGILLPESGSAIIFSAYNDSRITDLANEYTKKEGNSITLYISSSGEGRRL